MYKAPEDDENKRKNKDESIINLDESHSIEESETISLDDKRPRKSKIPLKKKIKFDEFANTVLFIAVFIGLWQLAYLSGIWPKVSLPSPIMVVESFYELILDNTLLISIGMTLYRLLIGFAASIGIGVCIGLAMVRFTGFGKTMSSFAVGLQSFPSVAWVPFAILLIGLNDIGILFVVIMSSVFSVMMSAYSGIRNIPPIYLKAARNMGAKGFSLFRYLMIPAATPALIIGIKQAWSFAWHALVGAEILMAASVGIGHILLIGREFQLMEQIIASMITIFALGMIFDKVIFAKLDDKVREKWGLRQEQDIENK
ncbi:ABC transporter permease [Candidatus Nitrosocosmicus arcticus]|uniref:ABC-type nitrate/sulfonate/bicarbonate transport system, permease component n=1 Tax=Candidatus Nitrosocosmicus arcticus TaxID=2035267 RepID=A0A557ST78_9ARCH|nr:ABC transporter permease [Candidatus Nitrosocosmicus arcticus]TVP39804.1 ABC-type nitrate/sulfonate/bicarbonate transport system, permease component [Candidatus Nitrosocosmicus arcticus]